MGEVDLLRLIDTERERGLRLPFYIRRFKMFFDPYAFLLIVYVAALFLMAGGI